MLAYNINFRRRNDVIDIEASSFYEESNGNNEIFTLPTTAAASKELYQKELTSWHVDTPNNQLRRARSSFILRQNSFFKDFEEVFSKFKHFIELNL